MNKKLIIYSKEGCGLCNQSKMYMKARGFEFEERRIDLNETYMEELLSYGVQSLPLITNGEKHITGFNASAINDLQDGLK